MGLSRQDIFAMTRNSMIAALALISVLATPVVVGATGDTASALAPDRNEPAVQAQATTIAAVSAPANETCARKIKVIYAGYGEGNQQGCAVR